MSPHRSARFLTLLLAGPIALAAHGTGAIAQDAPRTGDYLAQLSGLPQLTVDNPDQAAVYVDAQGNATSIVGDKYFTTTETARRVSRGHPQVRGR